MIGPTRAAHVRVDGFLGECTFKVGAGDIQLSQAGPLQLRTGAGDITVERAIGHSEITTGSGAVHVSRTEGSAVIKNSNGDIWVGEATADLRVTTANGKISVALARSDVEAKTANGSVQVDEVMAGTVRAHTAMGRVEVGVRRGVAALLDLETAWGKVLNGLDASGAPQPGQPSVEVRARTSFGDIPVFRANGPEFARAPLRPGRLTMADAGPAIEVKDLSKSFGSTVVLDGIDFTVAQGAVFSLLGPNGAGKTTVINILTTLLPADGGTATVNGFDVAKHGAEVRESISLTGQFAAVDYLLTGRENLVLIGQLRHVTNPARTAEALLGQFGLTEAADRRTSTYSGGMRRKLDIALGLIGDPAIIFFDEPTAGLDPESRNMTWDTIKSLADAGKTIFLTTQYLEEADRLADKIAILSHGRIVAEGTPQALKSVLPQGQIELRFAG